MFIHLMKKTYKNTLVTDLMCRELGGGAKHIAMVVQFSKFIFYLKDTEK